MPSFSLAQEIPPHPITDSQLVNRAGSGHFAGISGLNGFPGCGIFAPRKSPGTVGDKLAFHAEG